MCRMCHLILYTHYQHYRFPGISTVVTDVTAVYKVTCSHRVTIIAMNSAVKLDTAVVKGTIFGGCSRKCFYNIVQ